MVEENTSRDKPLNTQYYVLCLVDLLSQRNDLASWSTLPSDGQPTPEFVKAIKKTVGSVIGIKKAFRDYFDQYEAHSTSHDALTPEQIAKVHRYRDCDLHTQQFSDTVIFYSPIMNSYGDYSVNAIYRTLTACTMILTYSLAGKTPLRGAVCIGAGTQLEPNNFYGPAIARAHDLESKIAGYPRIVVDKEVLQFLATRRGFSRDPQIDTANIKMAELCRSFITPDSDGNLIVDFLGTGMFQAHSADAAKLSEAIKAARNFVAAEHAKFLAVGNVKLIGRYALLDAYIKSRLSILGIDE